MAKKKNAVLRPVAAGPTVESAAPAPLAAMQPIAEGGEENLAGSDVMEVAGTLVDLLAEADKLDEQKKALAKRIDMREQWLLERMVESKTQSMRVKGKTLYQIKDMVVSKAAGISTEQLIECLRLVGLADIVGETVPAPTLKAVVKEAITRAAEAKVDGDAAFCPRCGSFSPPEAGGAPCAFCQAEGQVIPMRSVVRGVPRELHQILYIENKTKLGCRSA